MALPTVMTTLTLLSLPAMLVQAQGGHPLAVPASPLTDRETVLPLKEARMCISHDLRPGRKKITSWVPAAEDLRQLQAAYKAIVPVVGLPDPVQGLPHTDVTPYYRQYAPVVKDGKRLILINGLSPYMMAADVTVARMNVWRTSEWFVFDGGRNVFYALYDVAERKIVLFRFNGK